jgi:hypothetical protein
MSDFNLISAIQKIAGNDNEDKVRLLQCKVNSVDLDNRIANVSTITGNAPLTFDVQLQAGIADGLLIEPAVESMVYVLLSKYTLPFIIQYSDVVTYAFNGDEFGGLVKVIELTEKLNNLEQEFNTLKQAFNSWIVVPSDGGGALKTITSSWASQNLTPTQRKEIENISVNHGS